MLPMQPSSLSSPIPHRRFASGFMPCVAAGARIPSARLDASRIETSRSGNRSNACNKARGPIDPKEAFRSA